MKQISNYPNDTCEFCERKISDVNKMHYSYETGGSYKVCAEIPVSLPYVCNYCGKSFCMEHRLPEAHMCSNFYIQIFDFVKNEFRFERK